MKKVYLSGPISDLELEEARANFARAEKNLIEKGFEIINPFKITPIKEETEDEGNYWLRCMIECLAHIDECWAICYVHHDRKDVYSYGSTIENLVAEKLDLTKIEECHDIDGGFIYRNIG